MSKIKKVRDGEEFVFCNGKTANTIISLKREIRKLSDEEFSFHVNDSKNDFYNWLRDCISPTSAELIKEKRTKNDFVEVLK